MSLSSKPTSRPIAHLPRRARVARRGRHRLPGRQLWLPIGALLVGLLAWQGLWMSDLVEDYLLPSPASVWSTWWRLAGNGSLWHHTSATLKEALLGFVVAFVVGVALGYPLAHFYTFDALLGPYVAASQAMPVIAFAPLMVVWFGLGLLPKVIICALIVFFPILVNTVVGLRSIDRTLMEAAATMGASRWQAFRYVEAPLMLRPLLGGVKMGITLAITGAMVGEFVAASAGLGYLMNLGRTAYDIPTVFVAAFTMTAIGIIGYVSVSLLEHLLITWE